MFCKTDEKPAATTTRGEQFEPSTDDSCDKNEIMLEEDDKQNNEIKSKRNLCNLFMIDRTPAILKWT